MTRGGRGRRESLEVSHRRRRAGIKTSQREHLKGNSTQAFILWKCV